MKKNAFLFFLWIIFSGNSLSQDISKDKIELYLYKDKHATLYSTNEKDSIIAKIFNDDETGKYHGLIVLEKQDSMVKVIDYNTINSKRIIGWVNITETSIIGWARDCIYELYDKPDYNSKKTLIDDNWETYMIMGGKNVKVFANIDSNFQVFDISGKWVKVRIIGKDKVYVKWLPERYRCNDIFGGCN